MLLLRAAAQFKSVMRLWGLAVMNTEFCRFDGATFGQYRDEILKIYLESGTSGAHDQYLDPKEEGERRNADSKGET